MARRVERPAAFAALVMLAGLGAAAAIFAPIHLGRRLEAQPQVVALDRGALEEALGEAPWFTLEPGAAPAVWLLTAPACAGCRRLESAILEIVQDNQSELRVLVVAPRDAAPEVTAAAAEFARRRDGAAFAAWRLNPDRPPRIPVGVAGADLGPDAAEGYAEWGRASFDRLAEVARRNDRSLAAPALFWKRGREWRMAIAPGDADVQALRADLEAQAPQ